MSKLLITGCSGAVGSKLTLLLVEAGYEVLGISGKSPCRVNHNNHRCLSVDIIRNSIDDLIYDFKPDVFVHGAWLTTHGIFWDSELNLDWLNASQNLIDTFAKLSGGYFLGIGTSAEYISNKSGPMAIGQDEGPKSLYGKCKLSTLKHLQKKDIGYGWARTFYQYSLLPSDQKVISNVFNNVSAGKQIAIKNPWNSYDFVFYTDVAENLFKIIQERHYGVVNLGSGKAIAINEVVGTVCSHLKKATPSLEQAPNNTSPVSIYADITADINSRFSWLSLDSVLGNHLKQMNR